MSTLADYIVCNEDVCGGEPRIRGTRITVRAIIETLRLYHAKAPVLQGFPDLTAEDVDAALIYYAEHPEEIEGYIKGHAAAEVDTSTVPHVLKPPRQDREQS